VSTNGYGIHHAPYEWRDKLLQVQARIQESLQALDEIDWPTTAVYDIVDSAGRKSSMNPIVTSALRPVLVFAGGVGGMVLHRLLPETPQTVETRDVVRLAIGMLSVLASLVLGLLISTAKASSDSTDLDVRSFSADVILLSETLRDYGRTAAIPAGLLRDFTVQMNRDIWPTEEAPAELADERTGQTHGTCPGTDSNTEARGCGATLAAGSGTPDRHAVDSAAIATNRTSRAKHPPDRPGRARIVDYGDFRELRIQGT
jgi:hypothetical protein